MRCRYLLMVAVSSLVFGCAPTIRVGEPVVVEGHTLIPISATTRYLAGANLRNLYVVHKSPDGQVEIKDGGSATASGPLTAILPGGASQAINMVAPLYKPIPSLD